MSQKIKIALVTLVLGVVVALSFGAGCVTGSETSPRQGLDSVEQAWDIIFSDYVDKDRLDPDVLSQAAIEGMLEALDDPYTSYLDAESYELDLTSIEGKFEGIGPNNPDFLNYPFVRPVFLYLL